MAPEHKFSTAAKLCADVLGGAADGGLDLAAAAEVVGDALRLLASKHMKARRHARAPPSIDADCLDSEARQLFRPSSTGQGWIFQQLMSWVARDGCGYGTLRHNMLFPSRSGKSPHAAVRLCLQLTSSPATLPLALDV